MKSPKDRVFEWAMAVFVVVVIGGTLWYSGPGGCASRWGGSKYIHRWEVFGGCQVMTDQGFVPEDRMRVMD